jgi:hypothetical protein
MTPEERQRAMDFILKSQADSLIRMDRLEESQRQLDRKQAATQSELDILVSVTRDVVALSRRTIRRVDRLESGENRP